MEKNGETTAAQRRDAKAKLNDLPVRDCSGVKGGATKSESWAEALAKAWGEALDRK